MTSFFQSFELEVAKFLANIIYKIIYVLVTNVAACIFWREQLRSTACRAYLVWTVTSRFWKGAGDVLRLSCWLSPAWMTFTKVCVVDLYFGFVELREMELINTNLKHNQTRKSQPHRDRNWLIWVGGGGYFGNDEVKLQPELGENSWGVTAVTVNHCLYFNKFVSKDVFF